MHSDIFGLREDNFALSFDKDNISENNIRGKDNQKILQPIKKTCLP